jgi:hypothetical protein
MRWIVVFLVVVCGPLAAQRAFAQTPATGQNARPYRGLFGASGNTDQSLALTLSLIGGYDTSVQALNSVPTDGAGSPATASALQNVRTAFEQASAGLNYSLSRGRASVTASGLAGGTRYQSLDKIVTTYSAGVGAAFVLSSRTRLSANEGVAYQPLFSSNLFPTQIGGGFIGQPFVPDTTTGARLNNFISQTTDASLTHKLSRRVDVSLAYGRAESSFASDESVRTQTATGRLSVNVTQHLSLWGSDGYFESSTTTAGVESAPNRGQLINFGIGYNRLSSLSLSRHLKLSLGVGGTVISDGQHEQLAVTGNATLNYEIARSWTASAGYMRSVGFVQFFQEPVTSDTLFSTIGGLITRRVSVQASAGVSRSSVAFVGPSNSFNTDYVSASLSCALVRQLSVGLGYSDTRYQFGAGLQLPNGVLSHTNGQTVYAFLNFWQPLFGSRRGNAPR